MRDDCLGTDPMAKGGLDNKMDAAAGIGRFPASKHQIRPAYGDEQAGAGREGKAEPVSRDQILRREQGQEKVFIFPVQLTTSNIGNLTPAD